MAAAARGPSKHRPIRWERVLPRRSLRVLLVENDDSTRHIVIALLRKCGYHVAAVADGVKAWEVLIEKEYNFDLVLAEVDMPSLSGIGLLSRIMGAEGCKNIPVIMMSPHDSVSVVLKCMLKGAVDFLVKPVRKNELQNLWQHVWRKHCSSSYANGSVDNAASNHISGNVVERSETGENSDEGNNDHHSGSKPEVDIGGDQEPMEPLHVGGNSNDELETKEDHVDQRLPMNFNCETGDKSRGIVAEATLPVQDSSLIENVQTAECSYRTFPFSDGVLGLMRFKEGVSINPDSYCHGDTREFVYGAAKSSHKDGSYGSSSSFMQLNGCTRQKPKEGSKLKHSDNSAFSRYGYEKLYPSNPQATSSTLCIRTTNCVDQHASHPITDGFANERNTSISPSKRLSSPQMKVGETPLYFQIPPNSNNDDAGFSASDQPREDACVGHSSTREDATFHPQLGYIAVPIPMGAIPYQTLCAGHHSILQPLFHCENSLSAHGSTAIGEHIGVPCVPVDQSNQTGSGNHDMLNVSWSNCSGEASNAVVNRGNALESGNESGVQNCNRKGLGHDHSQRAAALIKFRLKRKARCFEKKVRYFSRQKLAEQRPRVKGQFVRQKSVGSSKATDTKE